MASAVAARRRRWNTSRWVADINGLRVRRNRELARFYVAEILQPDRHAGRFKGNDGERDDEPVTREHRAGRLVADGAVRQFFPALRDERFPMEFQGVLRSPGAT